MTLSLPTNELDHQTPFRREHEDSHTRPARIVTLPMAMVFAATFGAMTSFYLLLSVVPQYAISLGGGGLAAGLTTGALMFATVAAEIATPRFVATYGRRRALTASLVLLGLPTFALSASTTTVAVLAVCVVRGIGFAVIAVMGGSLVAALAPRERRGEALGLYGVVVGVPSVFALPLGVWLVGRVGYSAVFALAAITALAALAAVPGIPEGQLDEPSASSIFHGMRSRGLLRPSIVMAAAALAAGVVVTFVPLSLGERSAGLGAVALLVHSVSATAARWWAGRHGDRNVTTNLMIPGMVASAVGFLCLVFSGSAVAALLGTLVLGTGFGLAQSATQSQMFNAVDASGYDAVSAVWNIAYDGGLGVGGAGFGAVASQTGYAPAFALTGALMLVALLPSRQRRRCRSALRELDGATGTENSATATETSKAGSF